MSVITIDNRVLDIDSSNFIYSKTSSRPSKSLVNPELYTKHLSFGNVIPFILGKPGLWAHLFKEELLEGAKEEVQEIVVEEPVQQEEPKGLMARRK